MRGKWLLIKKISSSRDALHRKNVSCLPLSPAVVQLRKLVAAGEIPDTAHACVVAIHFPERTPLPFSGSLFRSAISEKIIFSCRSYCFFPEM